MKEVNYFHPKSIIGLGGSLGHRMVPPGSSLLYSHDTSISTNDSQFPQQRESMLEVLSLRIKCLSPYVTHRPLSHDPV